MTEMYHSPTINSSYDLIDPVGTARFEAERDVLGTLLNYADPALISTAANIIQQADFFDGLCARIFGYLVDGAGKGYEGRLLLLYLRNRLDGDKALAELKQTPLGLVNAFCRYAYPPIALEACCREMKRAALRVNLQIAVTMMETEEVTRIANEIREIETINGVRDEGLIPIGEVAGGIVDRLADIYEKGEKPKIKTAFAGSGDLQRVFGGWMPGKFYVIGGRPGMGKSTAALSWLLKTASAGHGVAVFSLEMTRRELIEMSIANLAWSSDSRVEYRDIANFSDDLINSLGDKFGSLQDAKLKIGALPLAIFDKPGMTIADIRYQAQQYAMKLEARGLRLDVLAIDHLNLIKPDGRYQGNKVAETEAISTALKELAKELKCAVMCLVQLNRGVEGREDKIPGLADLRWSGAIEQDADVVMFVYREAYYLSRPFDDPMKEADRLPKLERVKNDLKVIIAKNRGGPTPALEMFADMGCAIVRDKAR